MQTYYSFHKLNWWIHFHQVSLRHVDLVCILNINSIRNTSDSLFFMVENNTDILPISETKLDDSFSLGQLKTCGFSMPYRYNRNSMGGRLLY